MSRLTVSGRMVVLTPCDGLTGYLRVTADGQHIGLIIREAAGYRTLPTTWAGNMRKPVCYCPTQRLAVSTLVAEYDREL
jgi:hypothetical protein